MSILKYSAGVIVLNIVSHVLISLYEWTKNKHSLWEAIMSINFHYGYVIFFSCINILFLFIIFRHFKKINSQKKFTIHYGVAWDEQNNMRCLNCQKHLKNSSSDTDPSIFFCSDPKCNSKHILKKTDGRKITKQEAIDSMLKKRNP